MSHTAKPSAICIDGRLWRRFSLWQRAPGKFCRRINLVYRRLWLSILTSSFGGQVMLLALPLTAAVLLKATPTQIERATIEVTRFSSNPVSVAKMTAVTADGMAETRMTIARSMPARSSP